MNFVYLYKYLNNQFAMEPKFIPKINFILAFSFTANKIKMRNKI